MKLSDWKALLGLGLAAVVVGLFNAGAGVLLLGVVALVTVMTHADVVAGWFGQGGAPRG